MYLVASHCSACVLYSVVVYKLCVVCMESQKPTMYCICMYLGLNRFTLCTCAVNASAYN